MTQEVNWRGLVQDGPFQVKWQLSLVLPPTQWLQQHARNVVLSWHCSRNTLMASLLGLLAKIKCSICSYQLNIWYGTHWVPRILWLIFGSRLRKRGLPPPSHGLSRYCTSSEYGPFPSGKLLKQQKVNGSERDEITLRVPPDELHILKLCWFHLGENYVAGHECRRKQSHKLGCAVEE